jgi:hypothetical protein
MTISSGVASVGRSLKLGEGTGRAQASHPFANFHWSLEVITG